TKLPLKAVIRPAGCVQTSTPAAMSSRIASTLTVAVDRSPRVTPIINSTIAPSASTSSGRIGCQDGSLTISGISASEAEQGGLGAADRVVVAVDQRRDRGGGHV